MGVRMVVLARGRQLFWSYLETISVHRGCAVACQTEDNVRKADTESRIFQQAPSLCPLVAYNSY